MIRIFFERWGWVVTIIAAAMAVYVVGWKEAFDHGYSVGRDEVESDFRWMLREEVVGPIKFDGIVIEKTSPNEFRIWRLKRPEGTAHMYRRQDDASGNAGR